MTEPDNYRLEQNIAAYLEEASFLHGAIFDRPWSRDTLRDLLVMPGTDGAVILSKVHETAFAGFVLFQSIGNFAEILTLAVASNHRGRGLGRSLMQLALNRIQETDAEKVILEVQDGNLPAIRLYESLGMMAFDRRRNYYKAADGSHADAILMQLFFDR